MKFRNLLATMCIAMLFGSKDAPTDPIPANGRNITTCPPLVDRHEE